MVVMPVSSGFRYDINGLRAIAVACVLLFHFKVPGFAGGFIGVDVFFVLSGFLMTSIIVKGLERRGDHSHRGALLFLWRFYVARARRIVPALLGLVGVLLALGWVALAPLDYRTLGVHGMYALAFLSNVRFSREAGYFDAAAHEKWLLHTWSLSVEWQFYLLLPLALLLIWRLRPGRTGLLFAVGLGIVLSLAASVWGTPRHPTAAFFLLPTRAWEMLAGGLVFLVAQTVKVRLGPARVLEITGLGIIGLSVLLFDANNHWPGANALLPVGGTMLVLLAARQSAWARNGAVQWVGLSSYSLYLWHWPVFVALVYFEVDGNVSTVVVGLSLSLLLGGLSYHFVENTSRRWLSQAGLVKAPATIAAGTLIVAMPALGIYQHQGLAGRLSPAMNVAAAEAANTNPRRQECHHMTGFDFPWCTFGGDDIGAVLVGDSHASTVITAVQAALGGDDTDRESPGVLYSSHTACPTLFGVKRDLHGWTCPRFNDFIAARVENLPSSVPLIIVNYGGYASNPHNQRPLVYFDQPHDSTTSVFLKEFREALIATTCSFAQRRRVYILRPIPIMANNVPRTVVSRMLLGRARPEVRITREEYFKWFGELWKAQDAAARACSVEILDTTKHLCDDAYCYGSENGRPLYYDTHHLSEYGNRKLIPMFDILAADTHSSSNRHVRREPVP